MSAVQGIVHGHKGALKVDSTPGRGSTFKLLFPAAPMHQPVVSRPLPSGAKEILQGSGLVLVVDDEEIVRQTIQNTLQRYGYAVIQATNGDEGVRLFREYQDRIRLVVLDLSMPVMGGEEALRQLQSISPTVHVILSSGFTEAEAIRRFTGKGLAGFIQKPYTAGALAGKVKAVLGETAHA